MSQQDKPDPKAVESAPGSKEPVIKSKSDSCKAGQMASFTEVIQTPGAAIKYTVHSHGADGLPDIEMSVSKDNEQAQKAALVPTVNPSEMAEVAKMIEQHNREVAERKKAKEERRAAKAASEQGRSASSESNVETIQTQLKEAKQCWKQQQKSQQPQECTKSGGPCTGCPKTTGSGPCAGCSCAKSK